ncbi:relaxase/mobilization nuclease domain-containing protein [Pyruvatibacter sp.]|uniref:relaxase/mobilization nuclease domain-containing protein n=1 Tax=Pyruvatibacter sp. TaxID=1981328 RepID=UPI003267AD9E
MILKGSQRGGAKQLGLHLLRTDQNEHVEVHEIRGFMSDDVVGALKEAYAVSRGTNAKQFLFSVSLNPPQNEDVSIETFEGAIDRIEQSNGMEGQPRIVVFHEKEGRRHAHAVWSRTDTETMTARPLPFFKTRLRENSKELYLENGWTMPRGLMDSREADPRNFTLDEWQQAKRAGHNPRDLKQAIQECWAVSDSSQSFANALEERGLRLAKGDRRGHVAITTQGEVFSIARSFGQKAKDVRVRLGEPDTLKSVEDTKAQIAQDLTPAVQRLMQEAATKAANDLAPLAKQRAEMTALHHSERQNLEASQKDRWDIETRERSERLNKGIKGLWQRMTGEHARIIKDNQLEAMDALKRDQEQLERLIFAQAVERRGLQEAIHAQRREHVRVMNDLYRDAARLRRGELPEVQKAKPAPQPKREAKASELKSAWDSRATAKAPVTRKRPQSPQERLDRLRGQDAGPRPPNRGWSHDR